LNGGDLVLCTSGEVVPRDGVVVEGHAAVNSADAENWRLSPPVLTGPGLLVREGSRLVSGYVVVRVTHNSQTPKSA
jgi:high-affinity K+ transport system ATPase subunit B